MLMYWLASLLMLLFGIVVFVLSRYLREGAKPPKIAGWTDKLVPLTLALCAVFLLLLPRDLMLLTTLIRSIHYLGIMTLFAFLIYGAVCQWDAANKLRRQASLESIQQIHRKWWIATKLMPAPAAFMILLSGLRLIYDDPAKGDIGMGWMFWLVVSFSFFFFDGLMFYLPEVCLRHRIVFAAANVEQFAEMHRSQMSEIMLWIHAISFPFVFALGCAKPTGFFLKPTMFSEWLKRTVPGDTGGAHCGQAAILVGLVGIIFLIIRFSGLIKYWKRYAQFPLPKE